MVRYERFVNNASTTLDGAINDSVTTITVADGSVFPSEGDYRVIVDEEIMIVTARSGNDLTVTRGAESTTAASQPDGSSIAAIITQGGMDRFAQDFMHPYCLQRQHRLLDGSGNILTASDFTVGNQGTSVVSDQADGSIAIAMQNRTGNNYIGLYRSAPSTPYTITVHVITNVGHNSSTENANCLGFRESGTSKLSFIDFHPTNNTFVEYKSDWTADVGTPAIPAFIASPARQHVWLRIGDDGTDLTYASSLDGVNFFELHSELRGTWFTTAPDQVWWGGDSQGGDDDEAIHLTAWIEG